MRIRALIGVCALSAGLAAPAAALAAGSSAATPAGVLPLPTTTTSTSTTSTTAPTTTAPTTTTTPAPTPTTPVHTPAPPATGRATLGLSGLVQDGKSTVTVPDRGVKVTGVVSPWRPGQRLLIQGVEGGRVFAQRFVTLRASRNRVDGGFTVTLQAPRAGLVAVRLTHSASKSLSAFGAERHYSVLSEDVHLGSTGPFVELLQARLAALHVYLPRTGVFDNGTELALDTYHRLLGEGEGHTQVDAATVNDLLDGTGAFHVRFPNQGVHAEGDLSDQVLAYVDNARVEDLLPISSGKPSTPTVLGSWPVYRKQPDYTSDGMYFSNFFTGGYAIHGYDPAPDYPASHGCMRIPIPDAIFAYNLLAVGDWVDTYDT